MNNTIAVILPIYKNDNPEWLHKAIGSIINQTYKDYHLFIGVDGPIGVDLLSVMKPYEIFDEIDIVKFEENRGLACVLNDLLDICFYNGYEFIARMDADDISLPERFEKQISFFKQHPDIDVVGGWVSWINENGESLCKIVHRPELPEDNFKLFAKRNPLPHPAVMFQKSFFDKAGCFYRSDHKKNQDTLLWYDGLKNGVKIGNVQDVILNFRVTNEMYASRRSGIKQAKIQLKDRLMINKGLHYGIKADIYAYCVFFIMIAPTWLRKFAYKIFR